MDLEDEIRRRIFSPRMPHGFEDDEERFDSGVSSILDKVHRQVMESLGVTGKKEPRDELIRNPKTEKDKIKNIIILDRRLRETVKDLIVALLDLGDEKIMKDLLSEHVAFLMGVLAELEQKK